MKTVAIKLRRLVIFALAIIVLLPQTVFLQESDRAIDLSEIKSLLLKVRRNASKNASAYYNDYQFNIESVTEIEDENKTKSNVFEYYCLENGKYCQMIALKKDGKDISPSKIQKAREKVSKDLIKKNEFAMDKNYPFYGVAFGAAPNVLIDPYVFLTACQATSASKKILDSRKTVLVNVRCDTDDTSPWKMVLSYYMSKTEAEIWIDELDESVVKMNVYAKSELRQRKPLIVFEAVRTAEGFWLFKKIRLETIGNKLIFPELKHNYQFNFFNYQYLKVDIESKEIKSF